MMMFEVDAPARVAALYVGRECDVHSGGTRVSLTSSTGAPLAAHCAAASSSIGAVVCVATK